MIMLTRRLKCKYTGTDEFMPKEISRDKAMTVVGYEVQRREVSYGDKKKVEDDLFLLVIGNTGYITRIASFCCRVMIDDNDDKANSSIAQSIGTMASLLLESSSEGTIHVKTT